MDDLGSIREDIGHLKSCVESHQKTIDKLFLVIEAKDLKDEKKMGEMTDVLHEMRDHFKAYGTVAKVLRVVGTTLILILTLKFGDVASLWRGL